MVAGLLKHDSGASLTLNGRQFLVTDVVGQLDGYETQVAVTSAAETAWKAQLAAEDALLTATLGPLMTALRSDVRARYGVSSPTLADYGVNPRKPRVRTSEDKALAAAKSKITRALRRTMGKRQRAKIRATIETSSDPTSGS
jgi:hypothetical protein